MTYRIADFPDPEETRRALQCRSIEDRITIAINCWLCSPRTMPVVTALVAGGFMVWIERTVLPTILAVDVYQLTPAGITLCEAEGIERQ